MTQSGNTISQYKHHMISVCNDSPLLLPYYPAMIIGPVPIRQIWKK